MNLTPNRSVSADAPAGGASRPPRGAGYLRSLGLWVHAVPRLGISLGPALICAALQACVFLPSTIEVYDPECQVVARQMTLREVQVAAIGGCQNQSCVGMILALGATAAASAIVSGSIVIVGNIAYWLERQSTCRRANETNPSVQPDAPVYGFYLATISAARRLPYALGRVE